MSFIPKKAFSNKLTKLIEKNPDVDIEVVLLHEDFSPTIRNESDILYQRILLDNDKSWLDKIYKYALFDKNPPKKYKKDNSINQINKNSASFLENCGRKFIKYFTDDQSKSEDVKLISPEKLKEILKANINEFISDENEIYKDSMYAGHFQRFIENFLRWDALDPEEIIPDLIPFLVNNCIMLAYQQLITRIICDYTLKIKNETIYSLLTQMLYRSYIAVKYIRKNIEQLSKDSALSVSMSVNKIQKLNSNNQPLNVNLEPIPLIGVIFDKSQNIQDLNEGESLPSIPWKKKVPKIKESKVKYQNIEDAEMEAYLLIMSIRTSISDQLEVLNYFRDYDEENDYPLIQALLYCGTRSDVKSLVSLEAFRLLSIIFNGSIPLGIEPWKSTEDEKIQFDFYNSYADEMIFDPTCLTYKMIHALPVFWNHHYNEDTYELSKEEKKKIDIEEYFGDGKKHFRFREPGETALEILQPCLLCEPPISSQLIYICIDIFIQLSLLRRNILKKESKSKEDTNMMVKIDGTVLDFYQHHFQFVKNQEDTTLSELAVKKVIIPLPQADPYWNKEKAKRRAPLNGFAIDFFLRMTSMKYSTFFQLNNNIISKIGQSKSIKANNLIEFFKYKDNTNFDKLTEATIYNKPIHSEFCFGDDVDDLETTIDDKNKKRNVRIYFVDELEKNIGENSDEEEEQSITNSLNSQIKKRLKNQKSKGTDDS